MKQFIIILTLLTVILTGFISCKDEKYFTKGEGPNVSDSRLSREFDGISLAIDAKLEIFQDSVHRIELVGQQNILNLIQTDVSGNILKIKLKDHHSIRKYNPLIMRIYTPNFSHLDISGSGNIDCIDKFKCNTLTTNISGSGHINFKGEVSNSINSNISGSGMTTLDGYTICSSANFVVSGSGSVKAEWFKVDKIDAIISGSGNLTIYPIKVLHANISGSGNIYYHGQAQVTSHVSGSGKIKSLD